jgi:phage tail sheath protein FI
MADLHGVETIELNIGSVAVTTIQTAIIGLVGTAPNASKGTVASRTTGTPLLDNELTFNALEPGRLGNQYSVKAVAGAAEAKTSASYAAGVLSIILGADTEGVIIATAAEVAAAVKAVADSKIIAVETTAPGIVAPFTALLAGGTDEPFPLNTPVAVIGGTQLSALGAAGTLGEAITDITNQTNALIIVVRAADKAEGKAAAVLSTEKGVKLSTEGGAKLLTEQKFAVDPDVRASLIAAMGAWSLSESITRYRPRILIAPGFSEDDAIGKALETAANKLRAVAYVDCESMATAQEVVTRRQMYGARVELLRPRVSKVKANGEITFRPYSASAAGLRARIDLEKGWWWSKSNQAIANILGVEQVDEFILGDRNCQANLLNMENVTTIIRRDGFRHWGNRLCIQDPQWQFESVRRTADVIEDSIQETALLYVDRPLDLENIDDILGTINSYMRTLTKLKAIFGGRAWLDEELNTAETLAAGEVYIDYDFGPKSPTERITMRVRINNQYAVEELGTV